MTKLKIKIATVALSLAIMGTGCSKFLDVNENPNKPTTADVKLLLPSAAASTSHVLSNQLGINAGLWAQYWTQSPYSSQYKTNDRYLNTSTSSDRPWLIVWRNALQNYENVIQNYGQFSQHGAIAYLLKAYTFQMATDAWGDIPLKEALKGGDSLAVGYDTQEAVYDSVFSWIAKGQALIDPANQFKPGAEDLFFNGDMDQWRRFANTMKLRAYLRIVKAAPAKAEAGIRALQTANATFLEKDAKITYSSSGGNENPMFAEILGLGRTQNLVASSTAVDAMTANKDPRLKVLYTIVTNEYNGVDIDTVVGIPQGSYGTIPPFQVSFPSAATGALGDDNNSALAPVIFISAAESYFLQAEAAVRGWLAGPAVTHFNNGITASFTANNLTAAAPAYIATAPAAQWPATNAGDTAQIKAIIVQKYFAMNGKQTFEAWTEWRRTGFPSFFVVSKVGALGAGKFPLRLPYPNTELTTNAKFPGAIKLDVPVWWDK
jgi:hypothetical protein